MSIKVKDSRFRYDAFDDGKSYFCKKGRLPAMGWNSWNAFGSGNSEALTRAMVDKIKELELDKLGYRYVILDDGCYRPTRVDGHLAANEVRFPSGFEALSDYVHEKGLLFGMYNDVGSRLCSGQEVGISGYEEADTADYLRWKIDFIKIDNCYNLWDNATFSDAANARYTFAPNISSISISGGALSGELKLSAVKDGVVTGRRAFIEDDHVTGIGTFDGTGPDATPVGEQSSELRFEIEVPEAGEYELRVEYQTGKREGVGSWLQVAVGFGNDCAFDEFLPESDSFTESDAIRLTLQKGVNTVRLMNHRRQENTLSSYAKIQECFEKQAPDRDIVFSICEWGKTQPQNWGYKVGDSWRILNDITFQVGSDGDSGVAQWESPYTTSVTAQYNKNVIMDEFASLDRGWNDPDMFMIGMNGLNETMCKTHMSMWCMMNAPLMLGMDLRNVEKGDMVHRIISNAALIALDQDSLGVQAKRIFTTKAVEPDKAYIRDNDRIDVLAKPLADGSLALSFINVGLGDRKDEIAVSKTLIKTYLESKMVDPDRFFNASGYEITDLWSGESFRSSEAEFKCGPLKACDSYTIKIVPQ